MAVTLDNGIHDEELPLKDSLTEHDGLELQASTMLENDSFEHAKATREIMKKFREIEAVGLLLTLDYLLRSNIFVLYARTFDDCPSHTMIGVVIYLSFFVSGAASFFCGYLGDTWRFDYMLCIAALVDVITFAIEASASSFTMLATAYVVGGQPLQSLLAAYALRILPLYYSQKFQIELTQFLVLGGLLGPVLGGAIASLFNFRAVFIVSAVIATVLFVFCLFRIAGTHTYFINKMEPFRDLYNRADAQQFVQSFNRIKAGYNKANRSDAELEAKIPAELRYLISDDYKFPMCIAPKTEPTPDTESLADTEAETEPMATTEVVIESRTSTRRVINPGEDYLWGVDKYTFYLVLVISFAQSIAMTSETAMGAWYTVYMKDRYEVGVLLSTGILSFSAVFLILGSVVVKILFYKFQVRRDFGNSNNNNNNNNNIMNNNNNNNNSSNWIHGDTVYNFGQFLVLCVIVAGVVRTVLSLVVIPENLFGFGIDNDKTTVKYTFWVYISIMSLSMGVVIVACNVMMVNVTPYGATGRLVGLKVATTYWIKAVGALIVGAMWDISYDSLWYTMGVFAGIVVLMIVAVALFERSRKI